MRAPREDEAEVSSEPVTVTVVRSTSDPEVYATITPIGTNGVVMLAVHISGEHPRMPEAAEHGRNERAADPAALVTKARRLVARHVDQRAIERGTLVRERPSANGASHGALRTWPSKWSPAHEHADARRVVTAWAEGRMAALGATTWDLHWQDGQPVVSFRLPLPARQQCPACGEQTRRDDGVIETHNADGAGECPASGDRITGTDGGYWRTAFGDRVAEQQRTGQRP
jgi:hypothetical protein